MGLAQKVGRAFRTNSLVGLVLVTPVVATILIFNFLLGLTTDWLAEAGMFQSLKGTWKEIPLRAAVLMVIVFMFYLVGFLTRNVVGRRLYRLGDKVLTGIPIINNIYVSVRQISEALFTQRKTLFKEVVLVEYPRKGLHSVAFVTSKLPEHVAKTVLASDKPEPCITVFVPTTPNPTSGVMIVVPRSQTIPLGMPVADALTFVMSAGAVLPGQTGLAAPTLLDKLEAWITGEAAASEEGDVSSGA